ncbi:hypothetical protein MKC55_21055 [[Clostridium] innocuum]|nr:hypothetical protein [[Clostridium] innocuum]
MKIQDFGEKIGGAKKDLWKQRNLIYDDILMMNDKEKITYIKKDNIWKKPDYEALVKSGTSVQIVYFIKSIRDSLPKDIPFPKDDTEETYKRYIEFIENIRDHVMDIKTKEEAESFYTEHILNKYVTLITNKVLKAVSKPNWYYIASQIQKKQFCFSEEEKLMKDFDIIHYDTERVNFEKDYNGRTMMSVRYANGRLFYYPTDEFAKEENWKSDSFFLLYKRQIIANNLESETKAKELALSLAKEKSQKSPSKRKQRKKNFVPVQLKHIVRNGENYRNGRKITGQDYLNKFQFRGGEFGNWLNENDRQASLNYGYDAFMDLGKALRIEPKDISLGGSLAIAFGARGSGNALAHYESLSTVINLTKMKGAGSLAHEWGHALDDYIGKQLHLPASNPFASHHYLYEGVSDAIPSINALMKKMKYHQLENGTIEKTEFYKNSIRFDGLCSKTDHGYWQSDIEMFARCFACYVHDKLEYQSDYLTGHANSAVMITAEEDLIKAFPEGKEREEINRCFDDMISELKEKGYLHDYDYEKEIIKPFSNNIDKKESTELSIDEDGQFCLFDFEEEREL